MNYKVDITPNFEKEAKKLNKRYPSLKEELVSLIIELGEHPTLGTHLGNNVYKIRLAIASLNKGKSGGARIISFVKVSATTVTLLSIYAKGNKETITEKEIQDLIKGYL